MLVSRGSPSSEASAKEDAVGLSKEKEKEERFSYDYD